MGVAQHAASLLALGDPGEMDASQYVLVRDLVAADPDVLLLMSDVVYPAGDINAWRDAVYLPYFGLPSAAWDRARREAGIEDAIPDWQVIATPGNHDWYDGLNGFMYHTCQAEPLPPVTFSGSKLKLTQRLTRRIWQDPARPNRPMLSPLRATVARRWPRARQPGPMPWQPGPYFAIDLGSAGDRAAVRLVCVDTGIDGSIDVEQAAWVRRILAGPVPKVVITGKPLVTGNRVKDIPINRLEAPAGDVADEPDDLPPGLRDLLAEGDEVVATLAGDIHNYQRFVLAGSTRREGDTQVLTVDETVRAKAQEQKLPPVQLVAGGGGAYLSATHATVLGEGGELRLTGDRPPAEPLGPADHTRFPSRRQSVQIFGDRVGRFGGLVLLGAVVLAAGVTAALVWLAESGEQVCVERECVHDRAVVGAPFVILALVALLALAVTSIRGGRAVRAVAFSILALLAAAAFADTWGRELEFVPVMLGAVIVAVLAPLLPLLIPLLQFFPALARLIPLRTLGVAVFGILLQQQFSGSNWFDNLARVITLLAVALGFVALASRAVGFALRKLDDLAADRRWAAVRGGVAFLSLWPLGLVGIAIALLPGDGDGWEHARQAATMIVLIEVLVVLALFFAFALKCVWAARHTAPMRLLAAAGAAAIAGGVLGGVVAYDALRDAWLVALVAATSAASGAGVVLGTALAASVGAPAGQDGEPPGAAIDVALGGEVRRDRHLFRLMTVASVPCISEIAEATEPKFHKSFLKLGYRTDGADTTSIVFEAFGVDDERDDGADPPTRAHLVDRLVLRLARDAPPAARP